jgi:hypothetical protein
MSEVTQNGGNADATDCSKAASNLLAFYEIPLIGQQLAGERWVADVLPGLGNQPIRLLFSVYAR